MINGECPVANANNLVYWQAVKQNRNINLSRSSSLTLQLPGGIELWSDSEDIIFSPFFFLITIFKLVLELKTCIMPTANESTTIIKYWLWVGVQQLIAVHDIHLFRVKVQALFQFMYFLLLLLYFVLFVCLLLLLLLFLLFVVVFVFVF